jgi:BirA family biotin operon repressor/biotin-[acetyl-CoA-carboxylase] ligase
MIDSRKAAGILTEGDGNNLFLGIGVNVAQTDFPEEYRSKAGSIIQFCPGLEDDSRFILLEKILARLYDEIETSHETGLWRERLMERLYKKGETVTFAEGPVDSARLTEGILSGIGSAGELVIIPKGEKEERAFVTGELKGY